MSQRHDATEPLLSPSPQSSSIRPTSATEGSNRRPASKQQAKASSLKHSWYVNDVSQIDKKATLNKKGRFMVHPDGKGGYELAVNCKEEIWRVKIKHHRGGGFCTYVDGEDGELFPSLKKLIKHHRGQDGRTVELESEKTEGRGKNVMLRKETLQLCYVSASHGENKSTASQFATGREMQEYATTLEVTTHPESLIDVKPGTKGMQFRMKAIGKGKLKYQWQKDGKDLTDGGRIKGASTSTLSITAVQKSDEAEYTCVVADDVESVTSQPATLTLATPPQVTSHGYPESPTLAQPGSSVDCSVTATGTEPLSYQWKKDGKDLTDGDRIKETRKTTLRFTAVQKSDEGQYTCVVSNTAGTVTSEPTTLEIATPPKATSQPWSLTDVKPGSDVHFSVTATGRAPLSYQWQKDGKDLTDGGRIKGASTSTLSITAVQKSDEGGYTCVVSNTAGTVTSKPATLDLATPPQVTSHPVSQTDVVPGRGVHFSVTATGTAPLGYQWQKDGVNLTDGGRINGASTSTLSITAAQKSDKGGYTCVVTRTTGRDTSKPAALDLATTLEVTSHPENLIDVKPGTKMQFRMTAIGKGKLKYQWQKDGVYLNDGDRIKGASTSTLSITAVQKSDEAEYTCVVADDVESVASQPATLTLATPPQVTSHPMSPTLVVPGSDVQFSVTATGTAPLSYQWQRDGVNLTDGGRIKGASTSTLSITAVQKSDEGRYRSVVTNIAGTDTSTSSKLTLGIPKKWYIEETDAKKARYVLLHGSAGKNGSFLVFKNSNDMYALLVYHNESIFKLEINESIDENEKKYYTIGKDWTKHKTVTELIKHHRGITGKRIKLPDESDTKLLKDELKTVVFPPDELFHKPWHFVATPKDAIARMANAKKKEDGTFLVYKSVRSDFSHEESDSYVLLVYYQGEIKKMEIIRKRKTDGGEKFVYVLGKDGKNAKPHETVRLLIKYHRGSAGKHIELGDGNKVILFDYLKWEE